MTSVNFFLFSTTENNPPTLMLQLLGLLFACGYLKFKLPPITTSASWTGEKKLMLEGMSKQICDVFLVLLNRSSLTSMIHVTTLDPLK